MKSLYTYLRIPILVICVLLIFVTISCKPSLKTKDSTIPACIVKQIIDHNNLLQFLHPEIDERVPLIISDHLVDQKMTLSKFGEPVKILPESEIKTRPYLRFTGYTVNGGTAKVKVEYKIEGIVGSFIFTQDSENNWAMKDAQIWEH